MDLPQEDPRESFSESEIESIKAVLCAQYICREQSRCKRDESTEFASLPFSDLIKNMPVLIECLRLAARHSREMETKMRAQTVHARELLKYASENLNDSENRLKITEQRNNTIKQQLCEAQARLIAAEEKAKQAEQRLKVAKKFIDVTEIR